MTIIVRPNSIHKIKLNETKAGIQLRFEAESGDKFYLELEDEMLGYVIEQMLHYAWGITFEEAFRVDSGGGENDTTAF